MDDVELALFERQVEALEAIAACMRLLTRRARHEAEMEEMERRRHQRDESAPQAD